MVERVQEDERLRGDLPDEAAAALVEWASKRVAAASAAAARPDAEVEAEVQTIRAAARAAARAGETNPQRLLAVAEAEMAQRIAPAAQPSAAPPVVEQPAPQPTTAPAATAQLDPQPFTADMAAAVGGGAAPSKADQPQQNQTSRPLRRWNPFAGFLKRIRGGR